MNNDENIKDRLTSEVTDYVNLKVDAFKLSMVENLSTTLSSTFGVMVVALLALLAMLFFAAAITVLLSMLIGSMLWALVIMGAVLLIAAGVVYVLRDRLIINSLIRMFSRMFFASDNKFVNHER